MADEIARRTLAVAGQLQTVLFQTELLKRCDPETLIAQHLRAKIKHNALMVLYLHDKLAMTLARQAEYHLTVDIYCLWMWLKRACAETAALSNELDAYATQRDRERFFAATMKIGRASSCQLHSHITLNMYGNNQVVRELGLINDVENFLKQLNYCHLLVSVTSASTVLDSIDEFLTLTIGGGMVASPETYDHTQPCCVCLDELSVTANQGNTIYRRLGYAICDHLVKQIIVHVSPDDMIRHMPFLSKVDAIKLRSAIEELKTTSEFHSQKTRSGKTRQENTEKDENTTAKDDEIIASEILDTYDVFTDVPGPVYRLSELKYWLASVKTGGKPRGQRGAVQSSVLQKLDSDLSDLFEKSDKFEMDWQAAESKIFDSSFIHFHRYAGLKLHSQNDDIMARLLVGTPAMSPEIGIETLINSCYRHHLSLPLFKRLCNPEKADADMLAEVLKNLRTDQESPEKNKHSDPENSKTEEDSVGRYRERSRPTGNTEDDIQSLIELAERDLEVRRKNYADKLSVRSFSNLDRCVKNQRAELEKLLRVNVYGGALPTMFVEVKNSFLARQAFLKAVFSEETQHVKIQRLEKDDIRSYEWRQYVRSALRRTPIDPAMLPQLSGKFYELLSGPMFRRHTERFPQPPNTSLYFTVENVGLLPHLKEELANFTSACVHGEWMRSEHKGFYNFNGVSGVTDAHRMACAYIREAVFAVALFETIFQCGSVNLSRADAVEVGEDGPLFADGIYLTFEEEVPLVAIWGVGDDRRLSSASVTVTESDLYSVLYAFLHKHER